jgi:hypothetical protein
LDFVCNEQTDVLDILSLTPSPRDDIPLQQRQKLSNEIEHMLMITDLRGCANNDITFLQSAQVGLSHQSGLQSPYRLADC